MAFTWVFISCGVLLLSPPVTSGREVRARNGHQLKSLHWLCAYINLTDSGSYLPLGILTSNIRQGLPVGQCKYIFVLVSYGFFISRVCNLHSFYVHCDFTSTNYLHRRPSELRIIMEWRFNWIVPGGVVSSLAIQLLSLKLCFNDQLRSIIYSWVCFLSPEFYVSCRDLVVFLPITPGREIYTHDELLLLFCIQVTVCMGACGLQAFWDLNRFFWNFNM